MIAYDLIDAHCHLHEFSEDDIEEFKQIIILAVSDDIESSFKTLDLSKKYYNVIPAIGIHPWTIKQIEWDHIKIIESLVSREEIPCIGEIGLDRKFVPETFNLQLEIFKALLNIAKEYDLVVNLHAPNAWREVLDLVVKYDIRNALFHWYTGPIDILEEIQSLGYYVSVNLSLKIQKKLREITKIIDLRHLLTESDGPYEYRGLKLSPKTIQDTIREISRIKETGEESLMEIISQNFQSFLKGC